MEAPSLTLVHDADRAELAANVRRFVQSKAPSSKVRDLMHSNDVGEPDEAWLQMARQLGLQGIALPEEYGGSGQTFQEVAIVLEELGRSLAMPAYLSTVVLGANVLLLSADQEAKLAYLPRIAAGELTATVAYLDASDSAVAATEQAGAWSLTGKKVFVLDGAHAGLILVLAATPDGPAIFAVEAGAPGLARLPLETLDLTRKQADVEFENTPAQLVGTVGAGKDNVDAVLDLTYAGVAAEQVGGAAQCLEMSVDYANTRVQFGRQISTFQAVKHLCADMLIQVEQARAAAMYSAWCAAESDPDLPLASSLARAYASDAYVKVSGDTIQLHGGVGFTWEHDAHLYFKRAVSTSLLFGDSAQHRHRVGTLIGV